MLAGGGGGGFLYIYEPGYTAWKNATEAYVGTNVSKTLAANANSAKINITNSGSSSYSIQVNESVYKSYKTLSITVSVNNDDSGTIYWTDAKNSNYQDPKIATVTTSKKTYTFDVSTYSGTRYIFFSAWANVFNVYDIHFE
jgi:hypothetical protein